MIHKADPSWGTHLPMLIACLQESEGPVLELGMGISSTPVLHALCQNRFLLSLDSDPIFTDMFRKYQTKNHKIELVNWDEAQFTAHWAVALVDQKPEEQRKEAIKKLAMTTDFIVIHDTEPENEALYNYAEIYPLFQYRFDDTRQKVHTTVLSNFYDLNFLHYSIL
jgi:hypothetical protein